MLHQLLCFHTPTTQVNEPQIHILCLIKMEMNKEKIVVEV